MSRKSSLDPYPYRIAQTRDVLAIEIELTDGKYPSANAQQMGVMRFSQKTPIYQRLATTVERAGAAALRHGWAPITILAEYRVTRIAPDRRVRDSMNLGQAEANALSRAGVWSDDCVAAPVVLDNQYDPSGPDRVVITITRVHQRNEIERAARPVQPKRARGKSAVRAASAAPPSGRIAFIDGKPVPYEEAIKLIS